ncbi:unnamed protein product [Phaedon cochleariae]|uniref:Integrase core domain-containing protein n=1 Tax=Phaedon cochleariae TaxID=80249 RepID=A0A9N9S869_PHACE|nr:unnamed protein product [Phaedon cochleariae]
MSSTPESTNQSTIELATLYFPMGFQQKEIIQFLKVLHGKVLSPRTLKRMLSHARLFRRKNYTKIEDVNFIEGESSKSGQLHGYKWMHLRCLQNNLVVTQYVIRDILKLLDPEGVEFRRKKRLRRRQYRSEGPNYLWHVDSYDKLKPHDICINVCIDGFSRHIIWLKAGFTTSDPKDDLDQISLEWNVHRIRKTRNAIAPAGRPAIM